MTPLHYLYAVVMFILGQGLMLMWIIIPGLKEKSRIANVPFSLKSWWNCDWNVVVGNMIFGLMLILCMDFFITWKPFILDYLTPGYGIVGAFGCTIAQEKWGSLKKTLSKILDVKANISDTVTGPTTTVKETIQKGVDATGQDVSKPTT